MRSFLVVALLLAGASCAGGGSEGTGDGALSATRTLSGTIQDATGMAVPGAALVVLNSGDSTTTDEAGDFSLDTTSDSPDLHVEIQTGAITDTIVVPQGDPATQNLNLDLRVSSASKIAVTSRIDMWARIGNDCARFFQKKGIVIRQSTRAPRGSNCTVRFFVNKDIRPAADIPGGLEVRSCAEKIWRPLAKGRTGSGAGIGVGEIKFTLIDDKRNCEYRIAAPYKVPGVKELNVRILTLHGQRKS